MPLVERILLFLVFIAVVFKMQQWPFGGIALVLTLSILSILYLYLGLMAQSRGNTALSAKAPLIAAGYALSIAAVGVLFKLQYWPMDDIILKVALVFCAGCILFLRFSNSAASSAQETHDTRRLWTNRLVVGIIISAILAFTSQQTLLDFQYRNDPELARLTGLYYANPDDVTHRKSYFDYIGEPDPYFQSDSSVRVTN